jgi:hypothetical protein
MECEAPWSAEKSEILAKLDKMRPKVPNGRCRPVGFHEHLYESRMEGMTMPMIRLGPALLAIMILVAAPCVAEGG